LRPKRSANRVELAGGFHPPKDDVPDHRR
jgi:hypothetical protein